MIPILVTGSNGQLGSELRKLSLTETSFLWHFTDVDTLDITNPKSLESYLKLYRIQFCVNCAAYTAVDKAEDEPELAQLVNATAVKNLADACERNHATLIHISTDYVFDGMHFKPYIETDAINPVSSYGRSKAEGENILHQHNCRSVIIRTSWLYSAFGNNFVKTMLRLGKERNELRVVADQAGTPTWAADLAAAILHMLHCAQKLESKEIFHYSNEGLISWYDFAQSIMELEQLNCKVIPISSDEYPVRTKRPYYSVLDKSKFRTWAKTEVPYWKDSLVKCLEEIRLHVNK